MAPIVLLALVAALTARPAGAGPIAVSSNAIGGAPAPGTAFGRLVFAGGIEIRSSDRRFGGLSGLLISPDGKHLLAVSDHGWWVSARLLYDDRGHLSGLAEVELAPLRGAAGRPLTGRDRDAESLASDASGAILVAFEHRHRILRYKAPAGWQGRTADALSGLVPEPVAVPPGLRRAPANGGAEAIERLADGRLLVLTEGGPGDAFRPGWVMGGTGRTPVFHKGDHFRPTGAAAAPGGSLLLLERRFELLQRFVCRVREIAPASLTPGAVIEGRLLARIAGRLGENFEGIAASRGPRGRMRVYLVSDDNYRAAQRTLLVVLATRRAESGR